jgi:putative endonuclease
MRQSLAMAAPEILRRLRRLRMTKRWWYMSKQYFVYILASKSHVLYVGVTDDLKRRVWQHKQKAIEGFTSKYNVNRLVYFATTPNVKAAIEREKQIKGWLRAKKIALIESDNPQWKDLSDGWYDDHSRPRSE